MGSWIALIASTVIGGLVLISFQTFNNDVNRDMYVDTMDNIAYSNLDEVKQLIDYDFMRIGLGVNDAQEAVVTGADTTDLTFVMDSDSNGTLETIRYYLSDAAGASATSNPNDRFLLRTIDGGAPQTMATGLTNFRLQYFDAAGLEIISSDPADLANIRTLVVSLTMESDYGADADYPKLVWQGRFTPPSLITH
jgi:hypothetical protein